MTRTPWLACLALAGCAAVPLQPTVVTAPGPGRDFATFQTDTDTCREAAAREVRRASRETMQRDYDSAFGACMHASGDQVAGYPTLLPEATPRRRHPEKPANPALVSDIQGELMRLDYLQQPPDGDLGPKTKAAIRKFEADHGMHPSGTVSKALLERLQETSSNPSSGPPAS